MPYQSLQNRFNNPTGGYGDIPDGKFLTPEQSPGFFNQTFNDPYLYYHGYNRVPFQSKNGLGLVSPELPPQNVLRDPQGFNIYDNLIDILGGNNRSGFNASTVNTVRGLAHTKADSSPTDSLLNNLISALQQSNNQGFIKTPPIRDNQYSSIGLPNVGPRRY